MEQGLVHAVYSRHTFADDALAFAADLARRSSTALALSKRLLYELGELSFEAGIERGARVNAEARGTEDCRAGVRAFLARRGPT
jgi:methylglutaconyl-CoA hydratase